MILLRHLRERFRDDFWSESFELSLRCVVCAGIVVVKQASRFRAWCSRAFTSVALAPLKREIANKGNRGDVDGRFSYDRWLRVRFLTPWRNDRLHRPTDVNARSTVRQEVRDDHLTASVLARNALTTVTCLYREHDIARIVEGSE